MCLKIEDNAAQDHCCILYRDDQLFIAEIQISIQRSSSGLLMLLMLRQHHCSKPHSSLPQVEATAFPHEIS